MAPLAALTTTLLVATQLTASYGLVSTTPAALRLVRHHQRTVLSMSSLGGLAKKMKEKDLVDLREAAKDPSSSVGQALAARGSRELTDELYLALKKPKRCLSCVAEFRRKGKLGVIQEMTPPVVMSAIFREAGAHVLSVLIDPSTGGCTGDDVALFVDEQETARGDFPGPLPVIVHDVIIDEVQLAHAAALGGRGVFLSVSVLGDDLATMVQAAREYGLEPIIHARSAAEVEKAGELDPRVISLSGMSVDDMLETLPSFPEKCIKMAYLPLYDDEQLIEAEDAWRLRDAGFNSVMASELLFKFHSQEVGDNTLSIIKAICAKGSVKYTRASMAFVGKGEGAREYLGYLEM